MRIKGAYTEEKAYQDFHKKTGIQITGAPILDIDETLSAEIEELFYKSRSQPQKSIPRIEKLIEQHPDIPSLKNYLYVALVTSRQMARAKKVLEDTLEKHPNYVFAIANIILNLNTVEELKEKEHLLGNPKDVRELEGYDCPVHISAFKNYQMAVAHFETVMGNESAAIERLDTLIDLEVEKEFVEKVAMNIVQWRLKRMSERYEKTQKESIASISKQTVFLEKTKSAPKLHHPELKIFYTKSIADFQEEDIVKIESLPTTTLIADLEVIVEDGIRRWDHFKNIDFAETNHEFMIHALYWLGALKSTQSLQKVLNLLRMGQEFIDYWMSDWFEEYLYPTLYFLGESQLSPLKDFVLEDHIYSFYRLPVAEVLAQIAIQQPYRRKEVIEWYKSVFDHLLENPNNTALIDSSFISSMLVDVVYMRGIELMDHIESLHHKGWIESNVQGDFEKIKESIQKPFHPSKLQPLPNNIREFYSKAYKNRKASGPPLTPEEKMLLKPIFDPSEGDRLVSQMFSEFISRSFDRIDTPSTKVEGNPSNIPEYYETTKTVIRKEKKIGRNEPCPCGSGKKYKKCCL